MTPTLPRRVLFTIAVLSGLSISAAGLLAPGAEPRSTGKVFVGYLFGQPTDINFKLYTHIFHAFLVLDAEGNVRGTRNVPNKDLTQQAHKEGVKVVLSLGGWGWDTQFAAMVSKPESEEKYFHAVMKIIDENDYDGIDLDWEYPDTDKEVPGFERLSRKFRAALDELGRKKGRAMTLTMAAAANPGTLRWLKKDFLLETMDWINVMTYDYTGDWTNYAGHHSPLYASSKTPTPRRSIEATMDFLVKEQGIPADRLAVGIPLYGRGFPVAEPYASTKGVAKKRLPQGNYRNLATLESEQKWKRQWDDETKNPWLLAPDKSAVIGYDDVESVGIKTEWAMRQGFRGVFFWQIAADRLADGSNPLQTESRKKWEAGAKK
jgi:chitinase